MLADRIRERVFSDERVIDKAILSGVVIPSIGGQQSTVIGRGKTNGVVGLARIAQAADAVIPFNNDALRDTSGSSPRASTGSTGTTRRSSSI